MLARFKEVCETVLQYKDHRERLVRETVVVLLPQLAAFEPEAFVRGYLNSCLGHIITTLQGGNAHGTAYIALGEMAMAVQDHIEPQLQVIVGLVKEGITNRTRRTVSTAALTCVSMLARAVGPKLVPHMGDLVDQMFASGLSDHLVDALTELSIHIPTLLPSIQERLFVAISIILDYPVPLGSKPRILKKIASASTFTFSMSIGTTASSTPESNPEPTPSLTVLALKTLGTFNLEQQNLIAFVRDCVLNYLNDDNPAIRKQAAATCAALLLRDPEQARKVSSTNTETRDTALSILRRRRSLSTNETSPPSSPSSPPRIMLRTTPPISDITDSTSLLGISTRRDLSTREKQPEIELNAGERTMVFEIIERLLTVGIADPDPVIRQTVLESMAPPLDPFLGQADTIHPLFIALNDEVFAIRQAAMGVIGRLAVRNPAYVMPPFRQTLIQLLMELEYGGDSRNREEAARLLSHLLSSSGNLIKPYVTTILKVLIPKLREPDPKVASSVLATLGIVACICGQEMKQYLDELFPIIVEILQDKSSLAKRDVALRTLGQLVESTGYVVEPYLKYKPLLPTILNLLKSGHSWGLRREVVKVLGIIGALDPFLHKMNQVDQEQKELKPVKEEAVAGLVDMDGDNAKPAEPSGDIVPGLSQSSDEYFPTVAINALMRILREPGLSQHHNKVVQAVMFIFRSLGIKCVPFLPQVIPHFLSVVRQYEDSVRGSMFTQLGILVSIVKGNIKSYLDDIVLLIKESWSEQTHFSEQILVLVEQISLALKEQFKVYLPDLLPHMLSILQSDRSFERGPTIRVLHALTVFGVNVVDYLHLIIPSIVRLVEQLDAPLDLRVAAARSIGQLGQVLSLKDFASRIIHPLARVLEADGRRSAVATPGPSKVPTVFPLREQIMDSICVLVYQLNTGYVLFIPMMAKILSKINYTHAQYSMLVGKVMKGQPLVISDIVVAEARNEGTDFGELDKDLGMEDSMEGGEQAHKKLRVSQPNLKKVWEASQRSTKEDWQEWMRVFAIELLKESPSPALRACSILAQKYPQLARELFNAAFVSCWTELYDQYQDDLVRSLEAAFKSPTIPPEILQTLLNLAEFMEHDDKRLPIDIRTLGSLAEKCHAYAKALHYKELEFHTSPSTTIEALISINNQLQQPDAAIGILTYAKQHHKLELKENWYEKLQRWEEALEAHERKQLEFPDNIGGSLGRMRCLQALGDWGRLATLSHDLWIRSEEGSVRKEIATLAGTAAWHLGRWDQLPAYIDQMEEGGADQEFFRAIHAVHRNDFKQAYVSIDKTRELLNTRLIALVGESYNRAYQVVVRVQQMAELEEVIAYKLTDSSEEKALIREMWSRRLKGCQRDVDVWQPLLAVRALVVAPKEDIPTWLKFSSLCRKTGKLSLSLRVLTDLLGFDPHASNTLVSNKSLDPSLLDAHYSLPTTIPQVSFAYLKHLWAADSRFREEAVLRLRVLVAAIDGRYQKGQVMAGEHPLEKEAKVYEGVRLLTGMEIQQLKAKCYLKLGSWELAIHDTLDHQVIPKVLPSFRRATECDSTSYKAWHMWAVMNFRVVQYYNQEKSLLLKKRDKEQPKPGQRRGTAAGDLAASAAPSFREELQHLNAMIETRVIAAIQGFFRSIALAGDQSLQDILRLLTLWFSHATQKDVEVALVKGFNTISIDTWLAGTRNPIHATS